jgi:hypothetical protein
MQTKRLTPKQAVFLLALDDPKRWTERRNGCWIVTSGAEILEVATGPCEDSLFYRGLIGANAAGKITSLRRAGKSLFTGRKERVA